MAAGEPGRIVFLIGADDDVVLDPKLAHRRAKRSAGDPPPASRWAGKQADQAIVEAVADRFPSLECSTARTPAELLASAAEVVVVISYLTQPSYAWHAALFDALRTLESRGVDVYPSSSFKRLISCKADYLETLGRSGLPTCPTRVLRHAELVDEAGALSALRVEAALRTALSQLRLLAPASAAPRATTAPPAASETAPAAAHAPFRLVSKPSSADGGYGVAFWSGGGGAADSGPPTSGRVPLLGCDSADGLGPSALPLLSSLRLRAILTSGCDLPSLRDPPPRAPPRRATRRTHPKASGAPARSPDGEKTAGSANAPAPDGAAASAESRPPPFLRYLESVGFHDGRPNVLLQPIVPSLPLHFEIKIYFLQRQPFFAALVYGKESVVARVARPDTDGALFAYLSTLLEASRRAIEALPSDGRMDPKVLLRVDWCVGAPEEVAQGGAQVSASTVGWGAEEGGGGEEARAGREGGSRVLNSGIVAPHPGNREGEAVGDDRACAPAARSANAFSPRSLKRSLVWHATDAAAPERRLREAMETHGVAPLCGPLGHFINEVEIQPGFYVDWDTQPDRTIEPLADAYGEYLTRVIQARRDERRA
jgi:hypothetical protein